MLPDVTGLPFDEVRNKAGDVYMRRYYINGRSERYHHIRLSDDDDWMHDHPWDFTSRILHGSYTEHTPQGTTTYTAGDTVAHRAEDAHILELTNPVWTHFSTGPYLRTWGFHTPTGWVDYRTHLAQQSRTW